MRGLRRRQGCGRRARYADDPVASDGAGRARSAKTFAACHGGGGEAGASALAVPPVGAQEFQDAPESFQSVKAWVRWWQVVVGCQEWGGAALGPEAQWSCQFLSGWFSHGPQLQHERFPGGVKCLRGLSSRCDVSSLKANYSAALALWPSPKLLRTRR